MRKQNIDYTSGVTISPEKISWMETYISDGPGEALDLGCGTGLYSTWLSKKKWRVKAVDLNEPPRLKNVSMIKHDLEEGIPFPKESFDLIVAWDVLEHVVNEKKLWEDLSRVLRPSGLLVGSVPHSEDQRLHYYNLTFKHHIDKTHQREYSSKDIEERLRLARLELQAIELKGPVSPQVIAEFISLKVMRRPVALLVGAARRLGFLSFGELYADIFFAAKKPLSVS